MRFLFANNHCITNPTAGVTQSLRTSYRFQGARPGETIGQAAARELEETILRDGADTIAAFVGEPIHGAGGVFYPTDDYWPHELS